MNFDSPVTSQLQYTSTRSASGCLKLPMDGRLRAMLPNISPTGFPRYSDAIGRERLAERTRVAQELHDTLLQGFLAASMLLHAAVDRLSEDCSEKQRFSEVARLMDRTLDEGRYALQGLRSPNGIRSSLGEALAQVPSGLGIPSAADFRVLVVGTERKLKAGLRDEVYSIGREAILNACRHSQATDIETEIEFRPAELRIVVRDNGCGIDPQDLQQGRIGHWGLQGMRERAERIGARLRFWSRVALGTEIELCVPGRAAFESMGAEAAQ
jgi:signal transduction histidine kinase